MTAQLLAGTDTPVVVVGGGLTGLLVARLLCQRGFKVQVFERSPDPRAVAPESGRSINLALAERGRFALREAGLLNQVMDHTTAMPGRQIHALDGSTTFQPYGQQSWERIYSVERDALNLALIEGCEAVGAQLHFNHTCVRIDIDAQTIAFERPDGSLVHQRYGPLIAADGAGSIIRRSLNDTCKFGAHESLLDHGYKELSVPPTGYGAYRMNPHALHIWPRGGYMLIALPNPGGDFTATLFLPNEGSASFDAIQAPEAARAFFQQSFPDAARAMPDFERDLTDHRRGIMGTIRCQRWNHRGEILLLGDAAHAIVPFHGQGMNAAFEDCRLLNDLLDSDPPTWAALFEQIDELQRPNANAVADMALENYIEMRESVRHEKFHLKKALAFALEQRCPDRFIPRYSMVMFRPDIPYRVAFDRGRIQSTLLDHFTRDIDELTEGHINAAVDAVAGELAPLETFL